MNELVELRVIRKASLHGSCRYATRSRREFAAPVPINAQQESERLQRLQDAPAGSRSGPGAGSSGELAASILAQRRRLPAHAERAAVVAAVRENQVVVIAGSTGCGKTTQVPTHTCVLGPSTAPYYCTLLLHPSTHPSTLPGTLPGTHPSATP